MRVALVGVEREVTAGAQSLLDVEYSVAMLNLIVT
jgi:hypothetical protein